MLFPCSRKEEIKKKKMKDKGVNTKGRTWSKKKGRRQIETREGGRDRAKGGRAFTKRVEMEEKQARKA